MGIYFASSTGISFHLKQGKKDFIFNFEMHFLKNMNWQILSFKQGEPELIVLHC